MRLAALSTRTAHDVLDEPGPPADERIKYGEHPLHIADLRLAGAGAPLALILHGGVWKAEYDLEHTGALCEALRGAGVPLVA